MTERTIRSLAKELAGVFYEESIRSIKFRQAFPTLQAYMRGQWHQANGDILLKEPGWTHHIALARKMLVQMLSMPDARVSPLMKERMYDALIEEHNKALIQNAKVVQRKDSDQLH